MAKSIEFIFDTVEFISDAVAPYLANRSPAPGTPGVSVLVTPYLEIKDAASNVDDSETVLTVNRGWGLELAYQNSTPQNGYAIAAVADTEGGRTYYKYTITPPSRFLGGFAATIGVVAKDVLSNTLNTSYGFTLQTVHEIASIIQATSTAAMLASLKDKDSYIDIISEV